MLYSRNKILLGNKNEQNTSTQHDMNESQKYYVEQRGSDINHFLTMILLI